MAAPFDKRKALQNALAYTQQGKWDRAIAEYQAILKADPRDLTVCNNLGDIYARAGKSGEAIEQYLKLGELYRTDGLSVKAIAVYKKIAKLDPTHTGAYQVCADLYWEQGLVGEAKIQMATVVEQYAKAGDAVKLIEAYQKLIQFDPGNSQVIARLADLLVKSGRREEAAAEYDRAAQAAQAAGQVAESKRFFEKARELAPAATEANVGLAEILASEGKFADAAAMLTTITTTESGNAAAWRLLGEIQHSLGNPEDAVRALKEAVGLGVGELEVARPLGAALLALGRSDEVIALCQRVTDETLTIGDPDAAIALVRDLLVDAPQAVPLHRHLATVLMNLGRDAEAREALWGLARAHEASGDSEAAVTVYRQLVERDPADAEAQERLDTLSGGGVAAPQVEWAGAASDGAPELVLAAPEEPPTAPMFQSADTAAAAPEEETPLVVSPVEDLGLPGEPAPPAEAGLAVGGLEAAPSEDPFADFKGLGLASEEEANRLLIEEPAEGTVDLGADLPVTLEPEPAAADAGPGDAGGSGWIGEEIPTLELEEVPPDVPVPIEVGAPESAPAAEPILLPDLGGDETVGAVGYSVDALSRSLRGEPIGLGLGGADGSDGDDEAVSRIAEQLAEAEVYLKYNLEEKARERLLDAVRLEPEVVAARRKLKALYLQRHQTADAVAEMATIARILETRGRHGAAEREIEQGLRLMPDHPALRTFARVGAGAPTSSPPPSAEPVMVAVEEAPIQPPTPVEEPVSLLAAEPVGAPVEEPVPLLEAEPLASVPVEEPVPPPEIPLPPDEEEPGMVMPPLAAEPAGISEEMPPELRALLDEGAAEPSIEILPVGDSDEEQVMVDDLAEAEFYLAQSMLDEAQGVYQRMLARNSNHPTVTQLAQLLGKAAMQPREEVSDLPSATLQDLEQSVRPVAPSPISAPTPAEPSLEEVKPKFSVLDDRAPAAGGFVDLGAELKEEMAAEEQQPVAHAGTTPLVDGLIHEFQKGVREQLDEKDYETHYNLGIAYKEMELYDEAIQEFRLTSRDPARILECADLMGLCYLAKGQPEQAVRSLLAGLEIEGHPPEAYHSLHYDLGVAYEALGEVTKALEQFEVLQQQGARFRDVQVRIQGLRARLPMEKGPTPPGASKAPAKKKKISFI